MNDTDVTPGPDGSDKSRTKISGKSLALILLPTALYWYWESMAEGNIRIDLVLIYPLLFFLYNGALWARFRFWAILISFFLMVLNLGWAMLSYDLFDKNPG